MPSYEYKDMLNREFISISTLSELLSRTKRQVFRHISDKNLFSVKRDNKRYILKDDIIREYPHIINKLGIDDTNSEEEGSGSQNRMSDVLAEDTIDIYSSNSQHHDLMRRIDALGKIATEFQSTKNEIQSIKAKVNAIPNLQKVINASNKTTDIRFKRGVVWNIFLALIGISLLGLGVYGLLYFKDVYSASQTQYKAQLIASQSHIDTLSKQHDELAQRHTQTIDNYEESLKSMNQKVVNLKRLIELDRAIETIAESKEVAVTP